jgi:hypothetical protein
MFKNRKTSELTGAALDWAVAKCLDGKVSITDERGGWLVVFQPRTRGATGGGSPFPPMFFNPSTDPSQAYPIIEREKIATDPDADDGQWAASTRDAPCYWVGPTPLIAAMRCYVASKLGDEVEVPKELL